MKNILFPTDFSQHAINAFKYAYGLSRRFEAELSIFHAYVNPLLGPNFSSEYLDKAPEEIEKIKLEKLEEYVKEFLESFKLENTSIHASVSRSKKNVSTEIIKCAMLNKSDLVIMGTKGATDDEGLKLGSVTTDVVRFIKSPVLAIPSGALFKPIKRIVYCLDYEEDDIQTINILEEFSKKLDAEIVLLHISPADHYFEESHQKNYQRTMEECIDYENIHFEFLQQDDFVVALDKYIAKHEVDILAMLCRKNTLFERAFDKSITHKMAIHTQVPLLAFHD